MVAANPNELLPVIRLEDPYFDDYFVLEREHPVFLFQEIRAQTSLATCLSKAMQVYADRPLMGTAELSEEGSHQFSFLTFAQVRERVVNIAIGSSATSGTPVIREYVCHIKEKGASFFHNVPSFIFLSALLDTAHLVVPQACPVCYHSHKWMWLLEFAVTILQNG